jgi:eukaryotic-like serine/threonine-protein kinase
MNPLRMAEPLPRTLGKYEVISVIGKGGMGIVYKAKDPIIGRMVAVKTISTTQDLGDEELQQRFQMEAQSAGRLQHPNIATIYDFGNQGDVSFLVLEFVEGIDLAKVIDDKIPLSLPQKIDILIQIASGLAYAHEFGVVHRDMKPSNVRLTSKGIAKIIDFGLARFDSTRLTKTGFMSGTIAYMSPERIHGETGPSDDIFALGTIGWELLTYRHAFTGSTPPEVMMKIITQSPPAPSTLESLPPELDAIIMKGMAREVGERYETAQDYADALDDFRLTPAWNAYLTQNGTVVVPQRRTRSTAGQGYLPITDPAVERRPPSDHSTPTLMQEAGATEVQASGIQPAAATVIEPAPSHSAATVIEKRPGRSKMPVAIGVAALLLVTAAIGFVVTKRSGDAPIPTTSAQVPSTPTATSVEVTGTTPSAAPSAQATELEVQRRLLDTLRADLAGLQLDDREQGRFAEAQKSAQLAEARFGEKKFDESARLLSDAISAMRGLRQDHFKRLGTRPAPEPVPARPEPVTPVKRDVPDKPVVSTQAPVPDPVRPTPAPVTPAPAPAPTPEPAKPSSDELQKQATAFISRLARAYESHDVAFFREHDANFSAKTEAAIKNSPSQKVEMRVDSVDVNGDRARVALQRTDTFGGGAPPGVQRLTYTLERAGDSWRIVSVERR